MNWSFRLSGTGLHNPSCRNIVANSLEKQKLYEIDEGVLMSGNTLLLYDGVSRAYIYVRSMGH